jgi:preprotein translocase subunit SecE
MGEMANTTTEKAKKNSWFKAIKSEFKKIVWPDKESLTRESIAVIAVTIVLGLVIYVLDYSIGLVIATIIG